MAQKVNPIAVRLGFNRSPDSSWFSDYYYATLLYQDLNLKDYLNSIRPPTGNQLGFRTARCTIHHYPKRSLIHIFCLTGATSTLSSLPSKELVASGQSPRTEVSLGSVRGPKPMVRSKRGERSDAGVLPITHFTPLAASADGRLNSKAPLSGQKFQPVIAKRADGVTNLSSFAKHRLLQYLQKKAQNSLEKNPFNTFDSKENTDLILAQKKGSYGIAKQRQSLKSLKTRSIGPSKGYEINPLLSLNHWKQIISNQVQTVDALQYNTPKKCNTSSVSLINTCLNYYVMQYFFRFPLGLNNGTTTRELLRISGALRWLEKGLKGLCPPKGGESLRKAQGRCTKLKENVLVRPSILRHRPISRVHHYLWSNLQTTLSSSSNTLTTIMPIKVNSVYRSAFLLAQEIACKLEQKKSFRQISRAIFQHIEVCNYIKGIRISCSGRLNGAEIAKTECKKYGETSLHVFSDRIDYAYTKAFTPYGILGVKVWISYL